MSPQARKILIVAGEASGDLHGANLVKAMKCRDPNLDFYGVGGPKIKEAGVDRLADSADMAVVGFTEVFGKLKQIMAVRRELKSFMGTQKPSLLIAIDYPDFNIPLAKCAKKLGVPVFYYVSPQVWAWRRRRIKTIAEVVNAMAVILPFEESLYREANVNVQFVGHPLLDVVNAAHTKEHAKASLNLRSDKLTVGLLPGSRESEVRVLLPEMMKAAKILQARARDIEFILPLADSLSEEFVKKYLDIEHVHVYVVQNRIYDAIAASDLVLVASGTATLEAALLETPMIIVYKVSALSYLIGKTFIKISNIGLVNIIAGEKIVPELIQRAASGEAMAGEAMKILSDEGRMKEMKEGLHRIKGKLGYPGASQRAAAFAFSVMGP